MLRSKNDTKKNHSKDKKQNPSVKEREQKKEISQTNNEIIWWLNNEETRKTIVCDYL